MAVVSGGAGLPNASKEVYEFALGAACSDGKMWPEEQFKLAERLDPENSEVDRRKYQEILLRLGGLTRDQFLADDPVRRAKNYILKELPEHYHVRRKLKSKVEKNKEDKYDFLIYGHPTSDRSGNPRSYASPNEFFHHLIWLIGGSNDRGYCACKLCNKSAKHEPESLKKRIFISPGPLPVQAPPISQILHTAPGSTSPALQAMSMKRTASSSSTTSKAAMVSRAAVQQQAIPTAQQQVLPAIQQQILPTTQQQAIPMVQQQSQPATQQQVMPTTQHRILPPTQQQVTPTVQQQTLPPIQQQVIPTVQPRQTPVPVPIPMLAPTPIPTPVHNNNIAFNAPPTALTTKTEPQPDPITEGPVLFREGEVVWYKNNNAWRIGLVLELVVADGTPNSQSTCFVKPLAHSALQLETVLKIEADMRPFLAFSVPPVNMKEIQGLRMSQVDWEAIQTQYAGSDRQKQEIVGLEASKMAVVEVDKSYSTFNTIASNPADPTQQKVGGVFLGAERISVNEAVRFRLAPNEINPTWIKGLPVVMVLRNIYVATDGLHFLGDIYRLEETANQQPLPNQGYLPATMIREQQFRSEVRRRAGTRFDWVLVQQNQDKSETAIRGRFYETSKLMPILDAARFQAALSRSVVEDIQGYLNNHLDSIGSYMGRRKNRVETLSSAVPAGFFLNLGPGIVEDQS